MCKQVAEALDIMSIPVEKGLVNSDCRTNNSVQHLEGERNRRKEKISIVS